MTSPKTPKRVTGWLLAVLVLGGSISPPTYRHAHAGGDVAHNHLCEQDQQHHTTHIHCGHGHSHPHRHETHHSSAAKPPTSHAHVTVLGFELTLPISEHDDGSSDPDRDELPVIARALHAYVPIVNGKGVRLNHQETRAAIASAAIISAVTSQRHMRPTALSVLLCDAARHERTGVLRC